MDFLDFVRGPGLLAATAVFLLGTLWRLIGLLRRPRMPDLSRPHDDAPAPAIAALASIGRGLLPRTGFGLAHRIASINGYVMHIGLALVVFGYAPHIAFLQRHTGLGWPALPDLVMYIAAGATILSLILALVRRLTDPVLRLISGADDWVSWTFTFLPMITGMGLIGESSARILSPQHIVYHGPLAMHLLALELLLVWFPFGKLMHAVLFPFSRGATGLRFGHRGVTL